MLVLVGLFLMLSSLKAVPMLVSSGGVALLGGCITGFVSFSFVKLGMIFCKREANLKARQLEHYQEIFLKKCWHHHSITWFWWSFECSKYRIDALVNSAKSLN
jgi:hypothetical protein